MRGDPHLKITGVAISLADLLETQGKSDVAYDIYSDAVTYLRRVGASTPLTGLESLRLISLSYKLGQLALVLKLPESDEERWLTAAVEEALKASKLPTNPASGEETGPNGSQTFGGVIELPEWATTTDIAVPLEALGEFYARQGKIDHALPLYLHSTSILIPPKSAKRTTPPEEKCRGANMMLQISDLILRGSLNEDALHQAGAWAQKGLDVVKDARASSWRSVPACDEMLVAAYHGVAYMKELSGDVVGARRLYQLAVKQANALGLAEESETITKHLVTLKTQK
ncbi:hypothetical protein ONZ45_g10824 [Pleurotus djamor]|nr:hypothetical protein ONZ45_g10824 [Pleurotus djamor]